DSNPDKYILELLELLNQWLTGHILHNDKLISKES
ncbi:Iron-binding protein, hemerythrin, partial [human gut metagenome]